MSFNTSHMTIRQWSHWHLQGRYKKNDHLCRWDFCIKYNWLKFRLGLLHCPLRTETWGRSPSTRNESEKRQMSSGPLTSSFRLDSVCVQQTPRNAYWRANALRHEHLFCLRGCWRGGGCRHRGNSGSNETSRELLIGQDLPGQYQWTIEEDSDRQWCCWGWGQFA